MKALAVTLVVTAIGLPVRADPPNPQGCGALSGFVDQIEGDTVALILDAGIIVYVSRRCVPKAAREGDFVIRGRVARRTRRLGWLDGASLRR